MVLSITTDKLVLFTPPNRLNLLKIESRELTFQIKSLKLKPTLQPQKMNAEHEMNLSKTLSIFFVFSKFERFVTIQNIKSSTIENVI